MRSEAPVPTVGQVVAVVDAQLGSGLLRCLGCGGRLARWGFGKERDWKAPPFPDCGNGILLSRYLRFQELIADLLRRPVPVR